MPELRDSKYPIFLSQQKSNKSQPLAPKWCQHRDQLSLGYDTGVWTADEVKFPCAEQLGSECSPEMQWRKKNIFRAERNISSLSTPLTNSAEQNSSRTVLRFSSSVKFFRAIFLDGALTWSESFIYTHYFNLGESWYNVDISTVKTIYLNGLYTLICRVLINNDQKEFIES